MKKSFLKLLGLALALCLMLSGCSLVTVDEGMQLEDDLKALKKDLAKVLVEYDGGEVTVEEVIYEYSYQYNWIYNMYTMYGMTPDSTAFIGLEDEATQAIFENEIAAAKAEELGITLTEEEIANCEKNAQDLYDEQYASFSSHEDHAEMEPEAAEVLVEIEMTQNGLTKEGLLRAYKNNMLVAKLEEQIKGEITELSEEELQEAFYSLAHAQEAEYGNDRSVFETDVLAEDAAIYWVPAGYRTVKHILVKPEETYTTNLSDAQETLTAAKADLDYREEEMAAYNDTSRSLEEIQADIDAAKEAIATAEADVLAAQEAMIASLQDKLDEIYARIDAGEDFQTLIDEYGEDDGMKDEPTATVGYYVSEETTTLDPAFKEASMALAKVGDVSDPVAGMYGVHIIRYESEVDAGIVDFESVRETVAAEALATAQEANYTRQLENWKAAKNPVFHMENWGE